MARNYCQPGNVVPVTAPSGGVVSGQGVAIGELFGVATYTAIEGAEVEIKLTGVWDLAKASGTDVASFAVGDPVYWDATAGEADAASTANTLRIGVCVKAATSFDATVRVRLDGGAG